MRIIPFDGDQELEDISSLAIYIKAVPFEKSFVPAFFIQTPSDDYDMEIEELNALMDGVEIAQKSIDNIIAYILRQSYLEKNNKNNYKIDIDDEDEE